MHFVDLLPDERGYRVAASYDALRFPEDKNTRNCSLRQTSKAPGQEQWPDRTRVPQQRGRQRHHGHAKAAWAGHCCIKL